MSSPKTPVCDGCEKPLPPFRLAAWEDQRVQTVYHLLCQQNHLPPDDEHWHGWIARWIVATLCPDAPDDQS